MEGQVGAEMLPYWQPGNREEKEKASDKVYLFRVHQQ
jgi:hypothetical protein